MPFTNTVHSLSHVNTSRAAVTLPWIAKCRRSQTTCCACMSAHQIRCAGPAAVGSSTGGGSCPAHREPASTANRTTARTFMPREYAAQKQKSPAGHHSRRGEIPATGHEPNAFLSPTRPRARSVPGLGPIALPFSKSAPHAALSAQFHGSLPSRGMRARDGGPSLRRRAADSAHRPAVRERLLGAVPRGVEFVESTAAEVGTELLLDAAEAAAEAIDRGAQRRFRFGADVAREVDEAEQDV